MAITAVEEVTYESWGGYDDPRLPSRIWRGKLQTTGDGTGGEISAFLRFNLASSERLDNYYSLEELYMRKGGAENEGPLFETRNFGSFKVGVRFVAAGLSFLTVDTAGTAIDPTEVRALLPLFMGQQIFTGTSLEIVVIIDNVSGNLFDLWAGGYVWGPRSASAKNGGLQRPASGLFSV